MDTSSPWEYEGYSDPFDFDPTFSHLELIHQLSWADENPATTVSTNFEQQLECQALKNKLVDTGEIAKFPPLQDSLGATSPDSLSCKLTGELNNQTLALGVESPEFDGMFSGFDVAPFSSNQQIIGNAKERTGAPKVLLSATEKASRFIIDPKQRKLQRRKFTKNAKNPLPFPCTVCTSSFKDREGLRKHKLVHQNRHFLCNAQGCTQSFQTKKDLNRHKKTIHHESPKVYICKMLGCKRNIMQPFSRMDNARKHVESVHDIPRGTIDENIEEIESIRNSTRLVPECNHDGIYGCECRRQNGSDTRLGSLHMDRSIYCSAESAYQPDNPGAKSSTICSPVRDYQSDKIFVVFSGLRDQFDSESGFVPTQHNTIITIPKVSLDSTDRHTIPAIEPTVPLAQPWYLKLGRSLVPRRFHKLIRLPPLIGPLEKSIH